MNFVGKSLSEKGITLILLIIIIIISVLIVAITLKGIFDSKTMGATGIEDDIMEPLIR